MVDKDKDIFAGTDRQVEDSPEAENRRKRRASRDEKQDEAKKNLSVSDSPLGYYEVSTDDEDENMPVETEDMDDFISVGTNVDAVMSEMAEFTDDDDILDDFRERQNTNAGSDQLLERLVQYNNARTPDLSGGDLDAAWEDTDQSGEESVGGTVFTPDQDIVEELGDAVGIKYDYDEPLQTFDKLQDRDDHRWELNPDSADDIDDEDVEERDEL
jgi:hypothetical protein